MNKSKIVVPSGIRFISEWADFHENKKYILNNG